MRPVMWASSEPRDHPNNHCCLCKQHAGAQARHKARQPAREGHGEAGCRGNPSAPSFLSLLLSTHPSFFKICTMLLERHPHPPWHIFTQHMTDTQRHWQKYGHKAHISLFSYCHSACKSSAVCITQICTSERNRKVAERGFSPQKLWSKLQ